MKILIATDLYKPQINGVVTSVLNLQEQLIKMGNEVKVLTLSQSGNSYIKNNVYYVKSFSLKIYPDIRASLSIEDVVIDQLVDWGPDIIHTQCEFFTLFFAKMISKKCKSPIVHTYHTMYEHYVKYAIKYEYIGTKLLFGYLRKALKKCDTIIAPTKKVEKSLRSYGMENEVKIIPTGIDLSKFRREIPDSEIRELRESLNIGNRKVLITLGRIASEKNIDEILSYVEELLEKRQDFVYVIAGDGPYKAQLEKRVFNMGLGNYIVFTGMIDPEEIGKYYEMADIFTSASTSETQGLTYIEAMANGLPQVCRYDDCLDGILIDGCNGYFFKDSSEFMEKIEELLDNETLYKTMSENALETSEKHSKEWFGESVFKVYQDAYDNYEYKDRFIKTKEIINSFKEFI